MQINFKRLHHIQLCIPIGTEGKAREFYCEFLGLEEIEKPVHMRERAGFWCRIADIELHIGTEAVKNSSKRHPAFEVENLDEIKEKMQRAGLRIHENTPLPNFKRFSFFDPFNNRVELLEVLPGGVKPSLLPPS